MISTKRCLRSILDHDYLIRRRSITFIPTIPSKEMTWPQESPKILCHVPFIRQSVYGNQCHIPLRSLSIEAPNVFPAQAVPRPAFSIPSTPASAQAPPSAAGSLLTPPLTERDALCDAVKLEYTRGLPVMVIPLPSRQERCRFVVRPISNTVADLIRMIKAEDSGIYRVACYERGSGVRVAMSSTIEALLSTDFDLVMNERRYLVKVGNATHLPPGIADRLFRVKNKVFQLYEDLNVEGYLLQKEKALLIEYERIKNLLDPMEHQKTLLSQKADRRTNFLAWFGLGYMAVQFGVLARLTWWEYSWDIMEPVTYFVIYGTGMVSYSYFVFNRNEYTYPEASDRVFLLNFHRLAKKKGWDVERYNTLRSSLSEVEGELRRLRDPLHLRVPPGQMEKVLPLGFPEDILTETQRKLLNEWDLDSCNKPKLHPAAQTKARTKASEAVAEPVREGEKRRKMGENEKQEL